jgi:acetyl-CoA synthetase
MTMGTLDRPLTDIPDYAAVHDGFDLAAVERAILGDDPVINAAWLCCDRYCGSGALALICVAADGTATHYTFEELRDLSQRFAGALRAQGVGVGETVAALMPRTIELVVTALATWRLGALYQPLFTAFGPKAIEQRVRESGAKVIVTDAENRPKLDEVDCAAKIVTVGADSLPSGDLAFAAELAAATPVTEPEILTGDDPFQILFTSGTTGAPKPVVVPLRAIVPFATYVRDAIGLNAQDRFWNIADPGWGYGLYYAIVGPLALGHPTLLYDAPFTVEGTVRVIEQFGITNLAGSPTAFRRVIAEGPAAVAPIKGQLRAVSSAGEPLNPEVIRWFAEHLGTTIHDHYGQTELGMVLCNHHALTHPVIEGAAGVSPPGIRMAVIDDAGSELPAGRPGHLALDRTRSPLFWFTGYRGLPTPSLGERWYNTGDTAELNPGGSISFVGRDDDVITSSGYRIGPFDVESALLEHAAVVEAAVVGKPDPQRTEIVKAFVILQADVAGTPELAEGLRVHVRRRLAAHAYPREIEFVETLPKTPSGKIQRFILRNAEIAKAAAET